MKPQYFLVSLLLLISCSSENGNDKVRFRQTIEAQIREQTQQLADAEITDNLTDLLQHYHEHAISMPEYQPTLDGRREIESFYSEILSRQDIKTFQCLASEFIHLDSTIVEIGTFNKVYTESGVDSVITLRGKYWHVWETQRNGHFRLKGEAFGYFHPIANPEALTVNGSKRQPNESDILNQKEIPFELRAYNALMEKGVRTRDGLLRSGFFTEDGRIFPFADTIITGIDKIKPYLVAYSSRGAVTIDSIMCYTYAFDNIGNHIIEYDMFKVKWSRPDISGRTEGKGIRIWQRQSDHSLRLYREIGTHNHLQ